MKTGYVRFTPYLKKTTGTLTYYDPTTNTTLNLGTVWGKSPKKLSSGFCDGVYVFIYK